MIGGITAHNSSGTAQNERSDEAADTVKYIVNAAGACYLLGLYRNTDHIGSGSAETAE